MLRITTRPSLSGTKKILGYEVAIWATLKGGKQMIHGDLEGMEIFEGKEIKEIDDKEIEKINSLTSVIFEALNKESVVSIDCIATKIYKAGYEKAFDIAVEVIEQFKEITRQYLMQRDLYPALFECALNYAAAELKKKYKKEQSERNKTLIHRII